MFAKTLLVSLIVMTITNTAQARYFGKSSFNLFFKPYLKNYSHFISDLLSIVLKGCIIYIIFIRVTSKYVN